MKKNESKENRKRLLWRLPGALALALPVLTVASVVLWAYSAAQISVAPPSPPPQEALEGIDTLSISEWEQAYLQVYYPHTENQEINEAVDAYIDGAVADFKASAKKSRRAEKDEFSVSFQMFHFDEGIISFLFRAYTSHVGGQSADSVHTMTFDLQSGAQYDLASLFEEGGDYLAQLSLQAYEALGQLGIYADSGAERALLQEGTAPRAANFSRFVLEGDALRFYFEPGQIGSRGNPANQVDLPLEALRSLLRPRFVKAPPEPEPSTSPYSSYPGPPAPDISGLEGKKLVALTFDDGPHPELTPQLLDFLREEQVRATFYVLGCWVRNTPEIILRATGEGHQIGSHTYLHKDLTKLDEAARAKEIEKNAALLEGLLGYRPTTLRPPGGFYDDAVRAAAAQAGVPLILWSVDPKDWRDQDAETVTAHVLEKAHDGCIVIMHDYYPTSIEAAMRIIPALKAEGYTFVTVDELVTARGGAQAGDVVRERLPKK